MGRQWNTIIESLGPLSGGTMSINANLTEIEALLTTLQADVADGITVSSGTVTANVFGQNANNPGVNVQIPVIAFDEEVSSANVPYVVPVQISNADGVIGSNNYLQISGTVTAAPIRGTTTTGTLTAGTTNGTLFATNSTRNYLLVQCTSGTVFIDTNGTASATDDIQLTAGQGITFEGSFVPTGAIAAITSTGTARIIGVQG
jgi:hypothetical protein